MMAWHYTPRLLSVKGFLCTHQTLPGWPPEGPRPGPWH